ncbi:TraU family protein (plasmid) [Alteromonas macleodii]|uniref:TraU family protein n=1 Tax=Alteromonas macleodii TaxID=28108 RepID=UPI0030CD7ED1
MLIGLLTAASSLPSYAADKFNSIDLLADSFSVDFNSCVDLKVKGACEWWKCSLFGCSFKTTTIIEHYTPDVVISVYDDLGNSPFEGTDLFTRITSALLGRNSNGGANASVDRPTNVISRHVDVYGSPASLGLINLLNTLPLGLACEPGSDVLKPYFISSFNPYIWYTGFVDSLVNMEQRLQVRKVTEREDGERGSAFDLNPFWGGIFPRSGAVVSQDHFRASAVFAARAIDIVINGNSVGHFRQDLDGRKGSYYLPSAKFEEWDSYEGRFQMLYPEKESKCHILGDRNIRKNNLDGWSDRRSKDGDYAWHYWRRYKCCPRPRGYSLLFKVEWA